METKRKNMKTKIYKSYADFLMRENKEENGVSEEFAAEHPDFEMQNETNSGCWNCHACQNCYDCLSCYDCQNCVSCNFKKHKTMKTKNN